MTRCFVPQPSVIANATGEEIFLAVRVQGASSFGDALQALQAEYGGIRKELGLDATTEIWLRFFCSDITTQTPWIDALWNISSSALLCPIGQPPVHSEYVSLLAYHIKGASLRKKTCRSGSVAFEHGGYTSVMANYLPVKYGERAHAEQQTDGIIIRLLEDLRQEKASLANDVVRTWYYIRDIDNNYHDMIVSRRRHYEAQGLLPDTHFIASTGIEALAPVPWALSWMTVLTTLGLAPEQIRFLKALSNLSPTHVYGVNFERATRVDFGDRAHIHISGTASIDHEGHVVHVGDIAKQCRRTVENITALLEEGSMKLDDMRYVIVYLRDTAEAGQVQSAVSEAFGDIPLVMVRGAVCRPDWLIEMEGLAGTPFPSGDASGYMPYL